MQLNHRRFALLAICVALTCVIVFYIVRWRDPVSVAVRNLSSADDFTLLSLSPARTGGSFYGHDILGQTHVTESAIRSKIIHDFKVGLAKGKNSMALCFEPRHGIRIVHGGLETDYVICFECGQVFIYAQGHEQAHLGITAAPQAAFDDVLKIAGDRLAS